MAKRFKSSSAASLTNSSTIHWVYLIEAQRTDGILDERGAGLPNWKVTTHIVNHHQTLRARHLYAMVSANGE